MNRALTLCSLLVGLSFTACGDTKKSDSSSGACTAATATATSNVDLMNTAFSPNCIKVTKGATVTFTNKDTYQHTVTGGTTDSFDSGDLAGGATYTHVFNTTGTVDVTCDIHASMLLTVVVQ